MDMARIDQCVNFILDYIDIDEVIPETDPTNEAAALVEFAAQSLADNEGAELTALEAFWVRRMVNMYLQGALDRQGAQTE